MPHFDLFKAMYNFRVPDVPDLEESFKEKLRMAANNILMLRRREEMRAEKALKTAFQVSEL